MSGRPYTVAGVVAPGFSGAHARAVDLWLPATEVSRTADGFWIGRGFFLVARVADGVPLAQAEEEIRHLYRIETLMSPEVRAVRATLILEPLHVALSSRLRKLDVVSVSVAGAVCRRPRHRVSRPRPLVERILAESLTGAGIPLW